MKIGLIGLPKSGKTTLFNLLTGSDVATSRYDGGRAELHTGVARVPDPRVDRLSALFKPKKTTYATFEVVDLAGIAKGERQGLDTKEFRNADALLHVVRAFPDAPRAPPDPRRDIVDLETELILADLEVVERRLERLEASIKKQRKDAEVKEQEVLPRLKTELEAETPLRAVTISPRTDARRARLHVPVAEADPPLREPRREGRSPTASGWSDASGSREVAKRPQTRRGLGVGGDRGGGRPARRATSSRPSSPTSASPSRPSAACCATATRCSASSPSSRWARTRCARGRSPRARAPRTPPAPSTPTSRAASSAPRSTATTS